jgi:Domain of unknown function (DUF1707)/Cell wall-active antibiotics response 4TMS YvqF
MADAAPPGDATPAPLPPAAKGVELRVGDRERNQVVDVLNDAFAQGRLTPAELDERTTTALAARTARDLAPLVEDLPHAGRSAALPAPRPAGAVQVRGSKRMIAVMGGVRRRGRWRPDNRMTTVTVMGGADLDFRHALTDQTQLVMTAVTVMGGITILVPEDWSVSMSGLALMGGRDLHVHTDPDDAVVHLHVRGWALMGGIDIQQKPRQLDS